MKRILVFLTALALAGCAGTPSTSERPRPFEEDPERGSVAYGATVLDLVQADETTYATSPLPADLLWEHLPKVFLGLGFDVQDLVTYDPNRQRMAVANQRVRRLGGQRMSRLLDCGRSLTGEMADKGQVYVYLTTWLEPVEDGTRIHTRFEATAREGGTSRSPTKCWSTGRLERLIVDRTQQRAVAP